MSLIIEKIKLLINWIKKWDTAEPWQLYYQDAASPIMEECIYFHDYLMFYLILVFFFILTILVRIILSFNWKSISHKYLIHGVIIEIIWTLIPAIILLCIALPSFSLLYLMDEVISPTLTIKVVGHQWYWSYEYSDFITETGENIDFDSYMIPESDLELGQFRLLDVDNKVVLPVDTHIRIIVTGADVLHSFAVPSLAIKLDCVPGRLNQVSILIERTGTFYGQCSEICGVWHGFMPISIEAVPNDNFLQWINEYIK